jgi:hypothetical protein
MAKLPFSCANEEGRKRGKRGLVSDTHISATTQEAHDDERGSSQYL